MCRISHPLWVHRGSWTEIQLSSRLKITCTLFNWNKLIDWLIDWILNQRIIFKGKKGQHFHYCRWSGQKVYYSNSERCSRYGIRIIPQILLKWLSRVPSHPYVWVMSINCVFLLGCPLKDTPPKKYVFGSYVNVPEAFLSVRYHLTIYALQCKSLIPPLFLGSLSLPHILRRFYFSCGKRSACAPQCLVSFRLLLLTFDVIVSCYWSFYNDSVLI